MCMWLVHVACACGLCMWLVHVHCVCIFVCVSPCVAARVLACVCRSVRGGPCSYYMKRVVALHGKRSRPAEAGEAGAAPAPAAVPIPLPSLYDAPLFVAGGSRLSAATDASSMAPGAEGGGAGHGAEASDGAAGSSAGAGAGASAGAGAVAGVGEGMTHQPEADLDSIAAMFRRKRSRGAGAGSGVAATAGTELGAAASALPDLLDWRGKGF